MLKREREIVTVISKEEERRKEKLGGGHDYRSTKGRGPIYGDGQTMRMMIKRRRRFRGKTQEINEPPTTVWIKLAFNP